LSIIWLAQEITGGSENSYALITHGASFGPLVLSGEIWRLVTAMFLHIGWLHLLFNCFALFSLGRDVEAQYGYSRFGFIFLAAGYIGNLLSLAWRGPNEFSAGASGGVFGVLGAEMGFLFFHRHSLGEGGRIRQSQLIRLIVLNMIIGLTVVSVNNIAHLGGLIAGVGLGYLLSPRFLPAIDKHGRNIYADQASLKKRWWVWGGVLLALVVTTWGTLYAWNTLSTTLAHLPSSWPTLIPSSKPRAQPSPVPLVVYSDDFSSDKSGWMAVTRNDAKFQYSGGRYIISRQKGNRIDWANADRNFTDVVLTIDIQHVSGDIDQTGPFLIWRYVDEDNFYALNLTGDGYFSIDKLLKNKWVTLHDWEYSSVIKKGHQVNGVAIAFAGDTSTIYINGIFLVTITDSSFVSGDIGLGVFSSEASGIEVSYDNLVIYTIDTWTPLNQNP
jgi:membrane associated rhomboid family serine protease